MYICAQWVSNAEGAHHTNHILTTDRTFVHLLATLHTCDHVATLQKHAVHRRVHAYLTEDLILDHWRADTQDRAAEQVTFMAFHIHGKLRISHLHNKGVCE